VNSLFIRKIAEKHEENDKRDKTMMLTMYSSIRATDELFLIAATS
jgi:hypothetical protein